MGVESPTVLPDGARPLEVSPSEAPAGHGADRVLAPPPTRSRWKSWRWLVLGLLLAVLVGGLAAFRLGLIARPGGTPTVTATATPAYPSARGEVRPISQAKVGTLVGGVVNQVAVTVGQQVDSGLPLARIVSPTGAIEVLVAPWRGTVTDIPVHVGDTVAVGSTVALMGDLSRLQVETTDVDEFIVGRVRPGKAVLMTVDALNQLQLRGRVRSVSLEPRRNADGDDHYPTVIDLELSPPELRSGMTVRVTFVE